MNIPLNPQNSASGYNHDIPWRETHFFHPSWSNAKWPGSDLPSHGEWVEIVFVKNTWDEWGKRVILWKLDFFFIHVYQCIYNGMDPIMDLIMDMMDPMYVYNCVYIYINVISWYV